MRRIETWETPFIIDVPWGCAGLEASRTKDLLLLSSEPLEEDLDIVGEVNVSLSLGESKKI